MISTTALVICVCALFTKSITTQCIGAYNGFPAEGLAWHGMAWPSDNALAWEASAPWGAAAPCAASAVYAGLPYGVAAPIDFNEWGAGYSPATLAAFNGGGLAVTSASPISPTGVSMTSENMYEGPLVVSGAIPFLGAVALEGALPTGGVGAVTYGCGNGNVAMINEDYPAGYGVSALSYGPGIAGPAYDYNGLAGPVAFEAGIFGPAFYNNVNGARIGGCGCGSLS